LKLIAGGKGIISVAKELAAFSSEDVIMANSSEPSKNISSPFTANEDSLSGSTLPYKSKSYVRNACCQKLFAEIFF
jgi:hypothetical protein